QLVVLSGVRREVEHAVADHLELPGARSIESGLGIADENRPRGAAVALPQLPAAHPVVGGEEDRPGEGNEVARLTAGGAGPDVGDEGGAAGRAIGAPQ